jgi:hypothetical protein
MGSRLNILPLSGVLIILPVAASIFYSQRDDRPIGLLRRFRALTYAIAES